ncbi:TonB-dependent receptor [Ideonella sp. BN130291]|uniref:TonB-dependent receptor n=1 Tax=Ideonella sp. BN130291 TaxID=3112940 RepID=UPI002E25C34E|nr:TonB-dependent receptor [Ideonella sp. BN130291]
MTMNTIPRAVAVAAATFVALAAQAQSSAPQAQAAAPQPAGDTAAAQPVTAPERNEGLNLERVVVTGTSVARTKMKQSVSISTMDIEQVQKSGALSSAELLRSVPGVRSESSGGEGNANITVRGAPISAGGSRYVQFQEDGLPVLLFGDIAFGTADQFLRTDFMLDRLEALRGGSASTLASNSPGGVINFISMAGEEGGSAGLSLGLGGHTGTRLDFTYGGSFGSGWKFQVGGFQRAGQGARESGYNAENGGQLRGNLTKTFADGFVRLSFKHLDDRTPSYMPVPVMVDSVDSAGVGHGSIHAIPGVNPRTAYFITPHLTADKVFTRDGGYATTNPHDGLHVKSDAIGLEASLRFGDGWQLSDKFRRASNSGRFIAAFPADNGSNGTQPFFTATLFNTSIDDLGNQFNDLKLSKTLTFGGANTTLTAGLFSGTQNVAETWFWNQYNLEMKGTNARVVDANGEPTTQPVSNGWQTWGGCCVRTFDVQYRQTAPYLALSVDLGPVTLDGSVRRDHQRATGWFQSGDLLAQTWNEAGRSVVNYEVAHTSYSVGANWQLAPNLALFARASDGVAFSADRLLYGNPVDGSQPVNVNQLKQVEGGVKWRSGGFSTFATLFQAKTKESNYEVTSQKFTDNSYDAKGLELELGWRVGDFRINGGATLTHARITGTKDGTNVGHKPRRQADLTYQLVPSYAFGPVEAGAALIGTTKSFGNDENTITMPAYVVVNPYASYRVSEHVDLSLSVNNAFNAIGYTEIEGDGHAARSINGRTVRVAMKYSF